MGDYLLLQWLGTRRGLAVFVLLLLLTVLSNLCHLSERERAKQIQSPAKAELKRRAQFRRLKPLSHRLSTGLPRPSQEFS